MLGNFRHSEKSTVAHSSQKGSKWKGKSIYKGLNCILMLYFFKNKLF